MASFEFKVHYVHSLQLHFYGDRDLDGFFLLLVDSVFVLPKNLKNRLVKLDPIHAQTLRGQKNKTIQNV